MGEFGGEGDSFPSSAHQMKTPKIRLDRKEIKAGRVQKMVEGGGTEGSHAEETCSTGENLPDIRDARNSNAKKDLTLLWRSIRRERKRGNVNFQETGYLGGFMGARKQGAVSKFMEQLLSFDRGWGGEHHT